MLLPFPVLLYPVEVGGISIVYTMQEVNAPEIYLLNAMGCFFNVILCLKTLSFYLTFFTLAECSDDISVSSFQGHKGVILGMANLGPMNGLAAFFSMCSLLHFSNVDCPFSCSPPAD